MLCAIVLVILGSANAKAGEGTVIANAQGNLARSRAEPASRCRVFVSESHRVVLRCGEPGFARAVFIIDASELDVIDVEPDLKRHCRGDSMTWRYRPATDTLKVVFEASGRFRCALESFTLTIDV